MYQEKKEEVDSLILKVAWKHQYKDSEYIKSKEKWITTANSSRGNISKYRKTTKTKKNWEKITLWIF